MSGGAEQDKGRRRRAEGAGRAAQKTAGFFLAMLNTNPQCHINPMFCAAGSGIFIPPPAP